MLSLPYDMELDVIRTLVLISIFLPNDVRCQVHFNCPQLPPLSQPAKTIHELRPQDIKVVMSLGDSVTAGAATVIY